MTRVDYQKCEFCSAYMGEEHDASCPTRAAKQSIGGEAARRETPACVISIQGRVALSAALKETRERIGQLKRQIDIACEQIYNAKHALSTLEEREHYLVNDMITGSEIPGSRVDTASRSNGMPGNNEA